MGVGRRHPRHLRPVFTLNGVPRTKPPGCSAAAGYRMTVLLSASPYVNGQDGGVSENVAKLCDDICETYGRTILFIAMQTPHDIGISRDIQRLMKNRAYVLDTRLTAEQIMGVIGLCDFVLAMRLHTLIFSARMCVPFIGMVYDPKVDAYIKALNMPSAGDVRDFDAARVMETVKELMAHRDEYAASLKRSLIKLETLAHEDAKLLLELLESDKKCRT